MKRIDVAIAVVTRGRRILICQRKSGDTFGGYWEFPGGKCEPGEEILHCLARELMEELGIAIEPVAKLSPIDHEYPHAKLRLHPYLCRLLRGELKLIECQKAEWIEAGMLGEYRFPPANDSLLREVQEKLAEAPLDGQDGDKGSIEW